MIFLYTTQPRITKWASKLILSDFSVEKKPQKDMGFVDFYSNTRLKPATIIDDDATIVLASFNKHSNLISFDKFLQKTDKTTQRTSFLQDHRMVSFLVVMLLQKL